MCDRGQRLLAAPPRAARSPRATAARMSRAGRAGNGRCGRETHAVAVGDLTREGRERPSRSLLGTLEASAGPRSGPPASGSRPPSFCRSRIASAACGRAFVRAVRQNRPMADDFSPITGRCMCGAVEVSSVAPFVGALYCHCKRCQRRSGTTRSMTALCPGGAFSVTAGEDKVRVWDPGDGWLKAFCIDCGSHTHTISPDDPALVAIRLGCLDADPGIRPQVHQFVAYASPLEPLPDDGFTPPPRAARSHRPALSRRGTRFRCRQPQCRTSRKAARGGQFASANRYQYSR
jgi:hypothetical protein